MVATKKPAVELNLVTDTIITTTEPIENISTKVVAAEVVAEVDNDTLNNDRIKLIESVAEKLTGDNSFVVEEEIGSSAKKHFSICALVIVFSIMLI